MESKGHLETSSGDDCERATFLREVDHLLEEAMFKRLSLLQAMTRVMPSIMDVTGASGVWVRTLNESLETQDFIAGIPVTSRDPIASTLRYSEGENGGEKRVNQAQGDGFVVARPLDVLGRYFGLAALHFEAEPTDLERVHMFLEVWCEILDNYLVTIYFARRKARALDRIADALYTPVLEDALDAALVVLLEELDIDRVLLVVRYGADQDGSSVHYRECEKGVVVGSSGDDDASVRQARALDLAAFLDDAASVQVAGFEGARDEVMIHGLETKMLIGRLLVTGNAGEFNTYDRDLLERFGDSLRQRVAEFNREWHNLTGAFTPQVARRLVKAENYHQRYLAARVEKVGILFADIAGFTRISEQVLKSPERIGSLIDAWSHRVVETVWEFGGTFDKMIGDCIVALWGPPFFEMTPAEICKNAIRAADKIRDITMELNDGALFPEFADMTIPVGVATGLNFTEVCVGQFGPNEDYTGFSSGMNNTARLQSVAVSNEILCSSAVVTLVQDEVEFGAPRQEKVKNVEAPLTFREFRRFR